MRQPLRAELAVKMFDAFSNAVGDRRSELVLHSHEEHVTLKMRHKTIRGEMKWSYSIDLWELGQVLSLDEIGVELARMAIQAEEGLIAEAQRKMEAGL